MIFFKIFICFFLVIKYLYAEIPDLENRNKETIKNNIVNTYIRSMNKWDIPFQDLLENRSGAACINWNSLTEDFLKTGMFDALGYSQNIPNKKASQIAAVSGCEKMKEYYKLENTCTCEVILTNDVNEVNLPIKKFDMKKEFEEAILLYRKNDYEQALMKFEKLSDFGDAKSQHNLAVMHYKGQGIPQNFNRAYYWSVLSMLNGQKKAEILVKNNKKRVSNINKVEIENEVKDNLEKAVNEGKTYAIIPLAKWHLTFPKKPDYNNSYLWLSVASALNIANSNKARNSIIKKIKNKDLDEIQNEANEIFNKMIKSKTITQTE